MLTMRKGFSISFADKLSEGYKTDGKFFTANVSAQSLRTKTEISSLSTRIFIILTIAPPL